MKQVMSLNKVQDLAFDLIGHRRSSSRTFFSPQMETVTRIMWIISRLTMWGEISSCNLTSFLPHLPNSFLLQSSTSQEKSYSPSCLTPNLGIFHVPSFVHYMHQQILPHLFLGPSQNPPAFHPYPCSHVQATSILLQGFTIVMLPPPHVSSSCCTSLLGNLIRTYDFSHHLGMYKWLTNLYSWCR